MNWIQHHKLFFFEVPDNILHPVGFPVPNVAVALSWALHKSRQNNNKGKVAEFPGKLIYKSREHMEHRLPPVRYLPQKQGEEPTDSCLPTLTTSGLWPLASECLHTQKHRHSTTSVHKHNRPAVKSTNGYVKNIRWMHILLDFKTCDWFHSLLIAGCIF